MGNVDTVKRGAQSLAQKAKDMNPYAKYYLILTVALAAITLAGLLTANHFGMSPSELFSFKATQIAVGLTLGTFLVLLPAIYKIYQLKKASDQTKAHASQIASQSQGSDQSAAALPSGADDDVPVTARARPTPRRGADLSWAASIPHSIGHSSAAAPVMGPPPPLPAGVDPARLPTPTFNGPPPAPTSAAAAFAPSVTAGSLGSHELPPELQNDRELLDVLKELRKCFNMSKNEVFSWNGCLITCSTQTNGYIKPAKMAGQMTVLVPGVFTRRWQQHFPTRPLPSFLTSQSHRAPASAAAPVVSAAASPGPGPAGPSVGPFPSGPARTRDFGETLRRFAPVAEEMDFIGALGHTLTHDTCAIFQDRMDSLNVKIIIKRNKAIIVVSPDKLLDIDQNRRLKIHLEEVSYQGVGNPMKYGLDSIYTMLDPAVMQQALDKYAQDKASGVTEPYRTGMIGTAL